VTKEIKNISENIRSIAAECSVLLFLEDNAPIFTIAVKHISQSTCQCLNESVETKKSLTNRKEDMSENKRKPYTIL